eukprot:14280.XXX_882480_882659_1 [CDS] Oithona nana genome sequencing.
MQRIGCHHDSHRLEHYGTKKQLNDQSTSMIKILGIIIGHKQGDQIEHQKDHSHHDPQLD